MSNSRKISSGWMEPQICRLEVRDWTNRLATVHHRMGNVKQLRDELSPRAVLPIVVPGSHLNQNAVIKTPKASRYMNTDRFPEKKSYSSFLSKMDSLMTKDKREIWRVSDEEEHPEGDIEAPRRGNSGYWKTRQF